MQNPPSPTNFFEEYAPAMDGSKPKVKTFDYFSFTKRTIDVILPLICLPFVLLLIIIFAILIKIDSPGPAFFFQERVGLNGKYFKVIKLRSMYMDAEKNGAAWAVVNDCRITRVGKLIRKTRIDELPQIISVLRGHMSLIGPRPERPMFTAEFEHNIPGFTKRLLVKPGLTGFAQVNGGYNITPQEKLKLDIYYIENMSIGLDVKILFKTIKIVFTGDGAR